MTSYLESRKQFVSFDGATSTMKFLNCGVPQGSILGPLLFLIYINDLPLVTEKLMMYMFAGDTNVFLCDNNFKQLEDTMNSELSLLSEWHKSYKLSLNKSQTHFMVLSPSCKKVTYNVTLKIRK